MKQTIITILLLSLILTLAGCGTDAAETTETTEAILETTSEPTSAPAPVALEELADASESLLNAYLTGAPRETILSAWGEPDGTLSGFWGDIFKIPDTEKQLILYYNEDGLVSSVKLVEMAIHK